MLTPIKNDYVYKETVGDTGELYRVVPAAFGNGTVALTYNVFVPSSGGGYAQYYQPWTSKGLVLQLTTDGFSASAPSALTNRRIRNPVLAPTGTQVLFLAEGGPTGDAAPAYQMLNVANGVITDAGTADPITGDYTFDGAPTAFLPGTTTAFVHRNGDQNPNPDGYLTPRATIDKVTAASGATSHTSIASSLAGWLDLRGVLPIDASTAFSAAGPLNMNGDAPIGHTTLRMYRLSTTDPIVTSDLTIPLMQYTPIYPAVTGGYQVETFSQATGASGPTNAPVTRYGISYDNGAFTATQLPLEQIDTHAQPPGATGTNFTTMLTSATYLPVDDQLFVFRWVYDNAVPGPANDTYIRITQYDGASGAVVDEVWTAGLPVGGSYYQSNQNTISPAAFYDASLDQVGVATTEVAAMNVSPYTIYFQIRVATFAITGYPISEQLRSTGSAFLG